MDYTISNRNLWRLQKTIINLPFCTTGEGVSRIGKVALAAEVDIVAANGGMDETTVVDETAAP